MLAYRLISSSPGAAPPEFWGSLGSDAGQAEPLRFSRYQDGLWEITDVNSGANGSIVYDVEPFGPSHYVIGESPRLLGRFLDAWRLTFNGEFGAQQLWVLVRFAGFADRLNEHTFVLTRPIP